MYLVLPRPPSPSLHINHWRNRQQADTGTPAANHGFGGNAMGAPAPEDAAAEQAYADSFASFSNINEHNTSTFQNLSTSNAQLLNNALDRLSKHSIIKYRHLLCLFAASRANSNRRHQHIRCPTKHRSSSSLLPSALRTSPPTTGSGGGRGGGQQNFQQQGRGGVPNPTKYFRNWNYCWSHGCD